MSVYAQDKHTIRSFFCALAIVLFGAISHSPLVTAAAPKPQNPQNGSIGVEGKIPSPPPSQSATIVAPANGQSFSSVPITVSGFCPGKLLVKIFDNNIFVGSIVCSSGSYSLQVDLFNGRNDLVARDYDSLDQQGPDSNKITVNYTDAQFAAFGTHVSLTSDYARRGADPGQTLSWPLLLSGGAGPYAVSVDWGDGKTPELQSLAFPGSFDVQHVYDAAGTYNVVVKVVDKNGTTAYLQLVGVANGQATQSTTAGGNSAGQNGGGTCFTKTPIWPFAIMIPIIFAAFWLGRRYELSALRKRIEQNSQF